jgi:hypothetical protein
VWPRPEQAIRPYKRLQCPSWAKRRFITELVDALIIVFRTNKCSGRHESARRDQVGSADETKFKGRPFSALKSLRPQQGVEQVTQQAGSDEGGE